MKRTNIILATALVAGTFFIASCKKDVTTPGTGTSGAAVYNIYERVGGSTMVADPANPGTMIQTGRLNLRSVVDSSIFVIAGDPQVSPYFATLLSEVTVGDFTGFTALSKSFTDFLCVATGSKSYTYSGKSMKDAHNPATYSRMAMKATAADFDKFVGDIVIGAAQNGVTDAKLVGDIGALLNSVKSDVVQQ